MKKVMIIGCGGAGKSTLSRQIGDILSIPVIHLDRLFWGPGWVEKAKDEWIALQKEICDKPEWIIDGNYGGSMDLRIERADTIIFLDFPRSLCLYRVIKRYFQYRGRSREDMTEGCVERIDGDFLLWIWNYRKNKRPEIIERLSSLEDSKQVFILSSPSEVSAFLQHIQNANK